MPPLRSAIVLGASGSVGAALLDAMLRRRAFASIIVLLRRSQPERLAAARTAGVDLREVLVPAMDAAGLEAATVTAAQSLAGEVVGLSVLGIGAGTAKLTIDAHRAVDVALNAAFARGLAASGRVSHLALMSAVGANPTAATTGSGAAGGARYARVKGEAEEAVQAQGPAVVSIFRPSLLIGSTHTPWLLEKILPALAFVTPSRYRSITTVQIAEAMIAVSLHPPARSAVYHFTEMVALTSGAERRS